ncbi:MAG: type 1 glutamine amidotransferase [Deltaproteobacteria bacterium]|nr:type 1 glutamine amidotransferase [Deltaproteobacteria bacterium]
MPIRYRLLQARLPEDRVAHEERVAFAEGLGVPLKDVLPFDMLPGGFDAARIMEGVDAVLVGGSAAFSVLDEDPWLEDFFAALRGLVEARFPTLASCFGFQALVVALGGEVEADPSRSEIGTVEAQRTASAAGDLLFGALPPRFAVQEGHGDSATLLPASVSVLATSERCPYQAIRVNGAPVWACQFHPELSGEANLTRFDRYWEMYVRKLGLDEAIALRETFRPSPAADTLVGRFGAALRSGVLGGR